MCALLIATDPHHLWFSKNETICGLLFYPIKEVNDLMEEKRNPVEGEHEGEIPAGQVWFDRIFFWLVLSILISALLYNVWGLLELF